MAQTPNDKTPPKMTPPPKRMPLFVIKMFLFAALIMLGLSFLSLDFLVSGGDDLESRAGKLITDMGPLKQPGEVSVIMLGDSRLRYAWRYGDTPDKTVTLPDGRTMRSLKIAQDNGMFMQFETLEEPIKSVKPDILVLQKSLLYRHPGEPSRLNKIRKLPYLMAYKVALWGDTGDKEWDHQQHDRVCTENYSKRGFEHRVRRHFLTNPPDLDGEVAQKAHAFLQRMLDEGITVAIMRIPPNMKAAEDLGVDPIKLDNIHLETMPDNSELVPDEMMDKLEWIAFPERNRIADFCDIVHMREETSEEFASWFKAAIAQIAN